MPDLRVSTVSGGIHVFDDAMIDRFAAGLRGELVRMDDPRYDELRRIWNGAHDRRPAAILRCMGVGDVVDAVNLAREHDLLVSVRGGGHNVAGTSLTDGGLMIDLSPMKGVRVDPVGMTAFAQPGCTWADLDRETQVFGLMTPGGNISSTGIAGLTLGGGMGWYRRAFGMSCDNLLAADIVTADGQLRTVDAAREPDLFWALKGGGGNFGIVTSFKYRLHPLGPTVLLAATMYPMESGVAALRHLRAFCDAAPDETGAYAFFMTVPSAEAFPPELHGRPVVVLAGTYAGPLGEAETALAPLREFDGPLLDMTTPLPYVALQQAFDWVFPKGNRYYWKTTNLRSLDDATCEAIVEVGLNRSSDGTVMGIWQLGGALSRARSEDSAYTRRDVPYLVNIDCGWLEAVETDRHVAWTRQAWQKLQPFSDGASYLHYDSPAHEDEVRAFYGAAYDRLVEIKRAYDPANMFRLNQNIRPDPAPGTIAMPSPTTEERPIADA